MAAPTSLDSLLMEQSNAAHVLCQSVGLLFVDISAAFTSIVRELAHPVLPSADEFVHRLTNWRSAIACSLSTPLTCGPPGAITYM